MQKKLLYLNLSLAMIVVRKVLPMTKHKTKAHAILI